MAEVVEEVLNDEIVEYDGDEDVDAPVIEDIGDPQLEGEEIPEELDVGNLGEQINAMPVGLRRARQATRMRAATAPLSRSQATSILRTLGFRIRTTSEYTSAVRNFQAGWNLGAALSVDGKVGPNTSSALLLSASRHRVGKGDASAHFSFEEVRCRCGGKYSSCPRIWQKRKAFQMMEKYRSYSGRPMRVVSACRCASHNKQIGGSPTSRHLTGLASDVEAIYSVAKVKSWKCCTHIGYGSKSRKVKHIDMGAGRSTAAPLVYVDGA